MGKTCVYGCPCKSDESCEQELLRERQNILTYFDLIEQEKIERAARAIENLQALDEARSFASMQVEVQSCRRMLSKIVGELLANFTPRNAFPETSDRGSPSRQ